MIGIKIRNLRIEKGMKQSELAEAAGLSRMSIGNYERGDRLPPVDIAARIANVLGVTVDYLLKEEPVLNLVPDKPELQENAAGFLEKNLDNNKGHGYDLYYKIVKNVGQLPEGDQEEILVLIEAKMRRLEGK